MQNSSFSKSITALKGDLMIELPPVPLVAGRPGLMLAATSVVSLFQCHLNALWNPLIMVDRYVL